MKRVIVSLLLLSFMVIGVSCGKKEAKWTPQLKEYEALIDQSVEMAKKASGDGAATKAELEAMAQQIEVKANELAEYAKSLSPFELVAFMKDFGEITAKKFKEKQDEIEAISEDVTKKADAEMKKAQEAMKAAGLTE